jgi:hypothetical protein
MLRLGGDHYGPLLLRQHRLSLLRIGPTVAPGLGDVKVPGEH